MPYRSSTALETVLQKVPSGCVSIHPVPGTKMPESFPPFPAPGSLVARWSWASKGASHRDLGAHWAQSGRKSLSRNDGYTLTQRARPFWAAS